jgi:hypothetical protein
MYTRFNSNCNNVAGQLTCHYSATPLPIGSGYFRTKHFWYKYSTIFKLSHPLYLSAYEDGTECSETSAYKIQTPGNYPEESIQDLLKKMCVFVFSKTFV